MAAPKAGGKPAGKPGAKKPEAPAGPNGHEILFWVVFAGFIIFTIIPFLAFQILGSDQASTLGSFQQSLSHFVYNAITTLHFISIFVSFLFIVGIMYVKFELRNYEATKKTVGANTEPVVPGSVADAESKPYINEKWQSVLAHSESMNPSDWRLAIIEADIILEEMLERMGYQGQSIGEKLKQVEPSDFNTLDNAWQAHKVRNAIAHQGGSFLLSKAEAQTAINNYKKVFEEFYFI